MIHPNLSHNLFFRKDFFDSSGKEGVLRLVTVREEGVFFEGKKPQIIRWNLCALTPLLLPPFQKKSLKKEKLATKF
jgi:hypothetical protein